MCVLLGYGADAICPYLVLEMAKSLREEGVLDETFTDKIVFEVRYQMLLISRVLNYYYYYCYLFFYFCNRIMLKQWIKEFQKLWQKWVYPLCNRIKEHKFLKPLV